MNWRALSPLHWGQMIWLAIAAVAGFLMWRWSAAAADADRNLALAARNVSDAARHHKRATVIQDEAEQTKAHAERRLMKLREKGHESLATKIARLNRL